MSIKEENLVPYQGTLKAGQRVIKVGDTFMPVGIGGNFEPGAEVTFSDATVTPDTMLEGVIGYGTQGKVVGTIQSKSSQTYTPGTEDQVIEAGKYLAGTQTIKGDPNLTSQNIKKGISIFNVAGNLSSQGGTVQQISFYQCASVDTAAGTWTGYKWEWDSTIEEYVLSSNLTSDELTIKGYIPKVELTYSADTYIKTEYVWTGPSLPVPGQLWGYKNGEMLFDNTIEATTSGTIVPNQEGLITLNNSNYYTLDQTVLTGASPRTFIFHANITGQNVVFIDGGGTASTLNKFSMGYGYQGISAIFYRFHYKDNNSFASLTKGDHIIAIVYDGTTLRVYVDTNIQPLNSEDIAINTQTQYKYRIGGSNFQSNLAGTWTSKFYAIYDRALSSQQILTLAKEFVQREIKVQTSLSSQFLINTANQLQIKATQTHGNTVQYRLISSTLPDSITFDESTGVFSGEPTEVSTYTATVRCYTSEEIYKDVTVTIQVVSQYAMPSQTPVLYIPLDTRVSGAQYTGDHPVEDGIPCAYVSNGNCISTYISPGILPTGTQDRTYSVWVKAQNNNYILFSGTTYTRSAFGLRTNSGGKFGVVLWDDDPVTQNSYDTAVWNHLAVTYSSQDLTLRIYVNGQLDRQYPIAIDTYDSEYLHIGSRGWGTDYLNGYIAAIRIYSSVLTETQIKALASEFRKPYYNVQDNVNIPLTIGEALNYSINAVQYSGGTSTPTGNTVKYAIISSDLPSTITFDEATGTFSGTPTTGGTYIVKVRCYTSISSKDITFNVSTPVSGTVSSIQYSAYSCPINPQDYNYQNWSITASSQIDEFRRAYNAFYDLSYNLPPWTTDPLNAQFAGWHSGGDDTNRWVQWKNNNQKVLVNAYSMANVNRQDCLPVSWVLEGSDDGQTWTTLDTVTDWSSGAAQTIHRTLSNSTAYYYHRINISQINSGSYATIGLLRAGVGLGY